MRARLVVAVTAACALAGGLGAAASGGRTPLDGLLFDLAVAARARILATPVPPESATVAVVGVDARSLASAELSPYPRALFGPVWGKLTDALGGAGAKAVAFDFLLSYSANALQPGYDRGMLAALSRWRETLVLGRSAGTLPAQPYLAALRLDPASVGLLEIEVDPDGVIRRLAAAMTAAGGERLPTLAAAALARAGGPAMPDEVLLAPAGHPETLPTYALIDVLRCAESEPDALRRAFGGRIVFIGTTLPEEDRKSASTRFLRPPVAKQAPKDGCALAPLGASAPQSRSVPGVHLHAAAAQGVLLGRTPRSVAAASPPLAAAAAAAGAVAGLTVAPLAALGAVLALAAALWTGQVLLLNAGLHVPTGAALLALAGAAVLAYVVRYLVEDRRRRRIQRAFGRYLAPAVVDRLVDDEAALRLGGEEREVTVMFADLSGFTALSTKIPASELVSLTNEYLAIVAAEVDRTGGYVDKFIGDAVMALWGAPVPEADHAMRAASAALAAEAEIRRRREAAEAEGRRSFGVKIGLYSGPAVVGNVGSERRYNYTAVGETVNVASRLESIPGLYGCAIVLGGTTAELVRGRMPLRELDWIAVKGRAEPLAIFEPGREEPAYAEALAHYRARRFAEAEAIWSRLAEADPPSAAMATRARIFRLDPPPDQWAGVWTLATK